MSEALVRFLAREDDRRAVTVGAARSHPDENTWALLADGLVSAGQRDELLRHAAACAECRRRVSAIVMDWDETLLLAGGIPTTLAIDSAIRSVAGVQTDSRIGDARTPARRPIRPLIAALLASVAVVAFSFVYRDASLGVARDTLPRIDARTLLSPAADLSALGVALDGERPRTVNKSLSAVEYETIIRKLSAHLAAAPPSAAALAWATRAALSAGEYEAAARFAARWCGADPAAAEAQNAYGLARFQLNAWADALAAFERALELSPDRPEYVLNAALAADRLGRTDYARAALKRVVTLAPDHPMRGEIDGILRRLGP